MFQPRRERIHRLAHLSFDRTCADAKQRGDLWIRLATESAQQKYAASQWRQLLDALFDRLQGLCPDDVMLGTGSFIDKVELIDIRMSIAVTGRAAAKVVPRQVGGDAEKIIAAHARQDTIATVSVTAGCA
jgi:hypothetical protein